MTLPNYIDPKISLGNILAVVAILVGFISSYGVTQYKIEQLQPTVKENRKDIDDIQRSQDTIIKMLEQQNKALEKMDNRLYNLVDKNK